MNNDLKELKARLLTLLSDDDNGDGEYSPGLKVALYELEHLDNPFVHGK